jgi:hypothetical protein
VNQEEVFVPGRCVSFFNCTQHTCSKQISASEVINRLNLGASRGPPLQPVYNYGSTIRRKQVAILLERGRLVSGTVLSAKRSNARTRTRSGGRVRANLRQTRITVAIDGESGQARFTTYKKSAAKLARFAMERKLPIVFLVAPEAPNATLAPAMMVASHHIGLAVETGTLDSITLLAPAPMS